MSSVSGCLEALEAAVAELTSLPVVEPAPECREYAERLLRVVDRAEAVLAGWVRRVDACREAQASGYPSTAGWLRAAGGMRDGRAKDHVALARQVPRLSETTRRLTEGRLSAGYATVIAHAVTRLNDDDTTTAEKLLLERVDDGWSIRQITRYADRIHDVITTRDGTEPEPDDARHGYHRSWLRLDASPDGGAYLKGRLDPEHAAAWHAVLDPLAKPAGDTDTRDHPQRLADAAYAVFTEGARHWDALVCIDPSILTPDAPTDARPTETPTGQGTKPPRDDTGAWLPDGTPLPAARARQLALNAGISALILGPDGIPLYLGRKARLVTTHQRHVIEALYPTCSVRDCDIPARLCEIDHIVPWSHGGKTDITNLAPKCGFHNRFKAAHPTRVEERQVGGRWETTIHRAERPPPAPAARLPQAA